MIELKGVSKSYLYGERVLGVLDLKIDDGEIFAVLGPQGSGKTTLLKTIAGVTECEGEICYDDKPVTLKTDDVVMVFDDLALFKNKSVYNNLAYPLKIRKTDKAEIDRRVKAAAELLGITASLYLRAGGLSFEEKKRIAAARLFVREAKVLVLDALTAGLSRDEADRLWYDLIRLLLQKKREGASVIYSTSDRNEAVSVADRIAVLHAGEVKQIGTARSIYERPESVWAAEALDPDYNALKAELSEENGALKLKYESGERADAECFRNKIIQTYIGKRVLVGAHPEGFAKSGREERVEYAVQDTRGYIHHTESGLKVRRPEKSDTVCVVPDCEAAILFDESNENSIMK